MLLGIIKKTNFLLIFLSSLVFILIIKTNISYSLSDPRGTLLLSQAITETGSIKLDNYLQKTKGVRLDKQNTHSYYFFPIGTSISSIPIVWFETAILKTDLADMLEDVRIQKNIISVVSVLIFLNLYFVARFFYSSFHSSLFAFLFWAGTSFSSTLGTALWSHDFAVLYCLIGLNLLLKIIKNNKDYAFWLSFCLFMSYLCRPTMSLFVLSVMFILLFLGKRTILIKTIFYSGFLFMLFVLFSLYEFGEFLPYYYMPKRLYTNTFYTALYGNLLSPSRGIFIFSPFLLLFFIDVKSTYFTFKYNKILLIFLAWVLLHLYFISKFGHWWGGYSYGSRFMVDSLPGLYVIFLYTTSYIFKNSNKLKKFIIILFLIITSSLSVYFNLIQGLFNIYSVKWSQKPNIDLFSEYLFDWKYPLFLYNETNHKARINFHNMRFKDLKPLVLNEKSNFNENKILLKKGWQKLDDYAFSDKQVSEIAFVISDKSKIKGQLEIFLKPSSNHSSVININNIFAEKNISKQSIIINFDKNILNDDINILRFNQDKPIFFKALILR